MSGRWWCFSFQTFDQVRDMGEQVFQSAEYIVMALSFYGDDFALMSSGDAGGWGYGDSLDGGGGFGWHDFPSRQCLSSYRSK